MRITKLGEDILRQKAVPFEMEEINDDLRSFIDEMFDTMNEANGEVLLDLRLELVNEFLLLLLMMKFVVYLLILRLFLLLLNFLIMMKVV